MRILLLISLCFTAFFAQAQKEIIVATELRAMSMGNYSCFYVDVPQADVKMVTKSWEKLIKSESKAKLETEGNELFVRNTIVERVSPDSIDIYAQIVEIIDGARLYVWVDEGDSFLVNNPADNRSVVMKIMMHELATENYREAVAEELKEEEKQLKNLEGDLDKLLKENEKFHKIIDDNTRSIKNIKDDIAILDNDQLRKQTEIESKKDELARLEGDLLKMGEKELKALDNELKKLDKKEEQAFDQINKAESGIRTAERDIQKNLSDQKIKQQEIDIQAQVVLDVKAKLDGIQ